MPLPTSKRIVTILKYTILILAGSGLLYYAYGAYNKARHENEVLKKMISRLEADSRVAEVLVTGVQFDEEKQKNFTTIKFLEYDAAGEPMEPKYFTFAGNIIQFQSLVIRFDDIHIREGDRLKGKSAYIFWKVFMLDGEKTQEYVINPIDSIPGGYKVTGNENPYEARLWAEFWKHGLNPENPAKSGIKNAQIEAPGSMFVPGVLYTIRVEHDGGLRIDTQPLSPILKGEKIL